MVPLATIQLILMWLYAFPPDVTATRRRKFAYLIFASSVIVLHFLVVTNGVFFIFEFFSINLEEALFAFSHTSACSNVLYQSVNTVLFRHTFTAIFKSLEKIHKENESEDSYSILVHTNKKCEWMLSVFIKYISVACIGIFITMSVVSVLYCYYKDGHFNSDHAYYPLKLILPWNQSTLLGYSLEICFTFLCTGAYLLTNGIIMILFVSMCLHHSAFYKMFRNEVSKFNFPDATRNDGEHLIKLIRFHVLVKDWFRETAAAFSPLITALLVSSMLFLSCAVFQLDLQTKHTDFDMVTFTLGLFTGISNLFLYCYFGKLATESFKKMSDRLYDCNWQDLSPQHQKYFIMMMANAQRPVFYCGFGVATLDLETFITMIRAVYSYYMIFKTLTANQTESMEP